MNKKIQRSRSSQGQRSLSACYIFSALRSKVKGQPVHKSRYTPLYTTIMIFFKLSPLDKNQVFIKYASIDMIKKDFDEFCKRAWSKKYGYLVIDTTLEYDSGNKYRFDIEIS